MTYEELKLKVYEICHGHPNLYGGDILGKAKFRDVRFHVKNPYGDGHIQYTIYSRAALYANGVTECEVDYVLIGQLIPSHNVAPLDYERQEQSQNILLTLI
jgi:hypothetical protein